MKPLPHAAAVLLSEYAPVSRFDDGGYSAIHRPGSWEWQTKEAWRARAHLEQLGYREEQDPEAEWRMRWVKLAAS